MKRRTEKGAKAKTTKRIVITTVLIAVTLLSTSAWIITSKAEEQAKNEVILANKEVALAAVSKQNSINTTAYKQEVVPKELLRAEKIDNELEAKKAKEKEAKEAKEKEELAKKAKADKLAKIAADKVKQAEASKLAKIAADKAKQEEIDRIAANRANKAKIDAEYKIAKAASDKAEKEKEDKLLKIETERLAKIEADKVANEGTQVGDIDEEEAARLAKEEIDRLAKEEVDRLGKLGIKQTANGAKLSAYLRSAANVTSVLNEAVRLHKLYLPGDPYPEKNNCVYFSSEAMRRIGVNVPLRKCNTGQYLSYLRGNGWVSSFNIKHLTPGSICFTTNTGAGYPTHTFVFMGWVNSGNYTLAYVADNQGNAVHVRNMGATRETDAFAFFMHN
ncbi:hypothetical protein [Clostridium sp.]|uniref:hypothetical protein n=1 Tax=Clostridium sp. TaxID=1506 RepID=UPI001A483C92|nr:hypothetical protein [Clostridium sp.]MBK5240654.1 hypothetical protein [Clostridium sp.]